MSAFIALAAVTSKVRRLFLARKLRRLERKADRLEAHAKQCRAEARSYWGEAQLANKAAKELSQLARDAESSVCDTYRHVIHGYRIKANEELDSAETFDEMGAERCADAYEAEKWAAEAREQAAAIRKALSA